MNAVPFSAQCIGVGSGPYQLGEGFDEVLLSSTRQ